jgi:hypothetical protein
MQPFFGAPPALNTSLMSTKLTELTKDSRQMSPTAAGMIEVIRERATAWLCRPSNGRCAVVPKQQHCSSNFEAALEHKLPTMISKSAEKTSGE